MSDVAIRVEGLSKQYQLGGAKQRYKTLRDSLAESAMKPFRRWRKGNDEEKLDKSLFWALKDVSFEIKAGEAVGIIGRNGAGKSTLLKVLSRITEPTLGHAEIHGRIGSLLEVGTGFHPELSGRENIYLNGAILGMRRDEVDRKLDEIISFAEIEKFVDTPVKFYSSGMYLRLAFAVAAHLEPEILLVDEVLAVGDKRFQEKCLGKMGEVAGQGRTVLLVSHNMAAIAAVCTQCLFIDGGRVALHGSTQEGVAAYTLGISRQQTRPGTSDGAGLRPGEIRLVSPADLRWDVGAEQEFKFLIRLPSQTTSALIKLLVHNSLAQTIMVLPVERRLATGAEDSLHMVTVTLPPVWLSPGIYGVSLRCIPYGIHSKSRFDSDSFAFEAYRESMVSGAASSVLEPPVQWRIDPAEEPARAAEREIV
jgi:lipopolysaccharide transport system ATP-binding protein